MNTKEYTSRLLCEGWLDKQVIGPSDNSKQTKLKTRFSTLTLFSGGIEIRFFPKKPKCCKELIQEKLTLLPWKYCVFLEICANKSYQLRLKEFNDGLSNPCTNITQMNMRSLEEAAVWMKCIQVFNFDFPLFKLGLTKLPSGCERNKFTVKTTRTKVFQQIGAAEVHCIMHFTPETVKLALKNDLTVIAIWPIMFIRSYSSPSANSFSVTAGRRSPMGEATYDFITLDMDAYKLFQVLDYYTGVTESLPKPSQDHNPMEKNTTNSITTQHKIRQPFPRHQVGAVQSSKAPTSPPLKPPRKPPLPANRVQITSLQQRTPTLKPRTKLPLHSLPSQIQETDADLDKLLHTLEYSLGMSSKEAKCKDEATQRTADCSALLDSVLDMVVTDCDLAQSKQNVPSYSTVDFNRKSLKKVTKSPNP